MPELPEVEVTRTSLSDRLLGARVAWARLGKPLRWPLGVPLAHLAGRTVGPLTRRGKYLWMPLAATPDDPAGLLLHLGMSGSLHLDEQAATAPGEGTGPTGDGPAADGLPPLAPHDHFELATTRGTLRLTDPRRFGAVLWSDALDRPPAATLLARLGAEPFDPALTPQRFHGLLVQRRSPIKAVLLSGEVMVGAGNIYVSEALFRAGIDPRVRADTLSRPRAERLLAALRETLARAIALGGSTLRDFKDAHGMQGAFQDEALVYGREGLPCTRCGQPVRRIVQAQRSTFFCPACQRR